MLQCTSRINWEVINALFYIFDGNDGEIEDFIQFRILFIYIDLRNSEKNNGSDN